MDNLRIWNRVCQTDPDSTDKVNLGRYKFTTIDAQYQIRRATETFGPCGLGWGVRKQSFDQIVIDPADPHYNLLGYTAELWFRDGETEGCFELAADIELFENTKDGWKRVKDPMKKVRTDALTKGLSWLGFSADVFEGRFDDAKYVGQLRQKKDEQEQQLVELKKQIQGRARFLGWSMDILEQFAAKNVNRLPNQLDIPTAETLLKEMKALKEVNA